MIQLLPGSVGEWQGQDRNGGEDDNDGDVSNVDGFSLTVDNTSESSHTEFTAKKSGAKLPSLHLREFYWNGERAKLRPYI